MKSVEQNILDFFRSNPTQVYDSGDLQRMSWFNKNGTLAKPKSVSRRLQELAEASSIVNVGDSKSAKYSLNVQKVQPKMRQKVEFINGEARITYEPV